MSPVPKLSGFKDDPVLQQLPNGVQVYVVGGAVRDQLLGRPSADRDWVVVGATPDLMRKAGFVPVGADFPVFLHPHSKEEYALARTERKSGHGYKGFVFHADPGVTLEQDLMRRDFTVNAMAMNAQGELFDPHGGLSDLRTGVLRHVSTAFAEDPLRVLRLARFLARFTQFSEHPGTFALCESLRDQGELAHLVAERIQTELNKGMGERKPSRMFELLNRLQVWASLAKGCEVPFMALGESHWAQLDALESPLQRWCYLLGCWLGCDAIRALGKAWRLPKDIEDQSIVTHHFQAFLHGPLNASALGEFLAAVDVYRKPARLRSVSDLIRQLHPAQPGLELIDRVITEVEQGAYTEFVGAKIQGAAPGAQMGKVAAQARQIWVESVYAVHASRY
jgi:tRNA nucleotidyltransferase (CCA-adding enzyme)